MEFLKNHYEKLILSVVLLLLTAAAASMPFVISKNKQDIEDKLKSPRFAGPSEYEPRSLTELEQKLRSLEGDVSLRLSGEHNLVNPVGWRQRPDRSLYREDQLEPDKALQVDSIEPLYLRADFKRATGQGLTVKYDFGIAIEASDKSAYRSERRRSMEQNQTYSDHPFVLKDIEGDPQSPSRLTLVVTDTNERVFVYPGQPYERLDGYKANLTITQPTERSESNKYVGDQIVIDRRKYKIVAIGKTEVTVEAADTKERTTVSLRTNP